MARWAGEGDYCSTEPLPTGFGGEYSSHLLTVYARRHVGKTSPAATAASGLLNQYMDKPAIDPVYDRDRAQEVVKTLIAVPGFRPANLIPNPREDEERMPGARRKLLHVHPRRRHLSRRWFLAHRNAVQGASSGQAGRAGTPTFFTVCRRPSQVASDVNVDSTASTMADAEMP